MFLERINERRISVDRLSVISLEEAIALADRTAALRKREFYGRAVISSSDARRDH